MAAGEGHGQKATIAALVANLGIAIAKFVAFVFTGSASMLAEGIHSVADSGNQALLLLGRARARRSPTPRHPFGYGRERYFWAFVVSIVLFTLGSLFSLFEGWEKIRHPHEISSVTWAVGVLSVGIVLETVSLRMAIVESNAVRTGSWTEFIRHSKIPELPVVLLEDIGAMAGLVFALAGVSVAEITGDPRWDAAGSLAIGVLLGVIAVVLAAEMKSLLIGEAATPSDLERIRDAMEQEPRLEQLIHMRTVHLGPDELLVAAKVELDPSLGFDEVSTLIDDMEERIRHAVPAAKVIYVEPDTADGGTEPPAWRRSR